MVICEICLGDLGEFWGIMWAPEALIENRCIGGIGGEGGRGGLKGPDGLENGLPTCPTICPKMILEESNSVPGGLTETLGRQVGPRRPPRPLFKVL